jgi:hypothetical protein
VFLWIIMKFLLVLVGIFWGASVGVLEAGQIVISDSAKPKLKIIHYPSDGECSRTLP